MRRALLVFTMVTTCAIVGAATDARADGYITPFAGINFANDHGTGRGNVGVGVGWMGAGIAGVDLDLGWAPNYFGSQGKIGDNHVLTGMANLIVGVPADRAYGMRGAGIRPYGTIGVGVMQTKLTASPSHNDLGASAGVGVMGFFSRVVGLRGDVRYFRNFRDEPTPSIDNSTLQFGSFHFWRASLGVVIRP